MGAHPTKAAENIYCRCRKAAAVYNDKLNSREGAAELLGISPSSLADYELGITKIIPVDKILLMADLYNAPELINHYCKSVCPLGENVPAVSYGANIDRITVETLCICRRMEYVKTILLDITADGVISEWEKPQLQEIITILDKVSEIAATLKVWAEKNFSTANTSVKEMIPDA